MRILKNIFALAFALLFALLLFWTIRPTFPVRGGGDLP
jgi:hypothetical protein